MRDESISPWPREIILVIILIAVIALTHWASIPFHSGALAVPQAGIINQTEAVDSVMSFHPDQPYTVTSTRSGGISGKVNRTTIQKTGTDYILTIMNKPPISGTVSPSVAGALDLALKNIDFSIYPYEDGSRGYDLSIWSLVLVQGDQSWRLSLASNHSSSPLLVAVQSAMEAVIKELNVSS